MLSKFHHSAQLYLTKFRRVFMTRTTHWSVRGHTKSRPSTVTHMLQTPAGVHRSSRQPPLRKRLAGAHDQCHQVTPVRHDANEQAWIVLRRHRASRQPHVAEVHVDSSVGELLVKPGPIRQKMMDSGTRVENGIYFQSGKTTPKNRGSLWNGSYGGKL